MPVPVRVAGVVAVLALAGVLAGAALSGAGGASRSARSRAAPRSRAVRRAPTLVLHDRGGRYGAIPGWLPRPKVPVDRLVTAGVGHPWLAIEGDTVRVLLARGRAFVTAVGPQVPEEGRFPVPATSPCSFTVTFAQPRGAIPLSARAFTFLDEQGHIHHPTVTLAGGGRLPGRVAPGRPMTLTVNAVLPTGSGELSWRPTGGKPIVSWDFDVEID
ncbi:MAG: hypothetical protein ABSH51_19565 [Solirubrobacteraceae bacterium]